MVYKNKTLLLSMLLANVSAMKAMERPVARPLQQEQALAKSHEHMLIEELSKAIADKDFDRYFALLSQEPYEQQKRVVHAIIESTSIHCNPKKALHFASAQGNADAVKKLLELGASIDELGPDNITPLLYASQSGDLETVTLLLEKGATKTSHDRHGRNALHWAAAGNHVPVIITLIKTHGFFVDSDPSYERHQMRSQTPLHIAAENGHVAAIATLIDLGAQKDAVNGQDSNALHLAAGQGKTAAAVALITKHGLDPNATSGWGKTALHYAIEGNGTCETVRALIENGASVESKDPDGWDPLHYAATSNKPAVIALLIKEYRLDPNSENKKGQTPLGLAINRETCLAELILQCVGAQCKESEKARIKDSCMRALKPLARYKNYV